MDLKEKKVVITGGSSGIGEELVKRAAEEGARVWFSYNSGADRAQRIAEATENRATPIRLELGNADSTRTFVNIVCPGIDYFIACAGAELSGDLTKHTPEEIALIVGTNLIGNLYLLREVITNPNAMSPRGQISVIGSIAADGNHDQFAYSASKAGLRGAVESLSRYDRMVQDRGLGVKLLEPAFVRTPMTERILKVIERRAIPAAAARAGVTPEAHLQSFREGHFVMEISYAAEQILALTADPGVVGVRTIPEGANLHTIRRMYL